MAAERVDCRSTGLKLTFWLLVALYLAVKDVNGQTCTCSDNGSPQSPSTGVCTSLSYQSASRSITYTIYGVRRTTESYKCAFWPGTCYKTITRQLSMEVYKPKYYSQPVCSVHCCQGYVTNSKTATCEQIS
jgi:hypothetical protein